MKRIRIQSRIGSSILVVLGAVYALAATALLVWFIADTWGAAGRTDHAMQFGLVLCAITGVCFVAIGLSSLDVRLARPRPALRGRQRDAATQS